MKPLSRSASPSSIPVSANGPSINSTIISSNFHSHPQPFYHRINSESMPPILSPINASHTASIGHSGILINHSYTSGANLSNLPQSPHESSPNIRIHHIPNNFPDQLFNERSHDPSYTPSRRPSETSPHQSPETPSHQLPETPSHQLSKSSSRQPIDSNPHHPLKNLIPLSEHHDIPFTNNSNTKGKGRSERRIPAHGMRFQCPCGSLILSRASLRTHHPCKKLKLVMESNEYITIISSNKEPDDVQDETQSEGEEAEEVEEVEENEEENEGDRRSNMSGFLNGSVIPWQPNTAYGIIVNAQQQQQQQHNHLERQQQQQQQQNYYCRTLQLQQDQLSGQQQTIQEGSRKHDRLSDEAQGQQRVLDYYLQDNTQQAQPLESDERVDPEKRNTQTNKRYLGYKK
ncbi:MAG: hypothetical protein J3R72DRAFT_470919 [Linnemannia gamsii]|nr:MAG: hypothetical protein J3R72DRAFT_470919 [Linnemannia gamsii]